MTEQYLQHSEVPLSQRYPLALVDLDGVAYKGHEPINHASDGLNAARQHGMRLVFVTNNASREPQDVAQQLTSLDIPAHSDDVMTAAQACARLLTQHVEPGAKVLVIGGAGLRTAVHEAGYTIVESADDNPIAVAQGFAPTLGWKDLAEAAYAVTAGALHVASNLDLSLPTARGFAPGNGSLVGAVKAATGIEPLSAGKPSPAMYHMAIERAGASTALVIGDRLDTDLAGARAGGLHGLHVLTGVSTIRDAINASPIERPHYLARDLRALTTTHPAVTQRNGWWVCGASAVRVVDSALEVWESDDSEGSPDGLDPARAACVAAWNYADNHPTTTQFDLPEALV